MNLLHSTDYAKAIRTMIPIKANSEATKAASYKEAPACCLKNRTNAAGKYCSRNMLILVNPHYCAGPRSFFRADETYYIEIDVDLHQLNRLFLRGLLSQNKILSGRTFVLLKIFSLVARRAQLRRAAMARSRRWTHQEHDSATRTPAIISAR